MFDDNKPQVVGKLRNEFLTDAQGRRIYCPPFGPARWVPSLEEEENLGRLKFRVLFVAMIVAVGGTTAVLTLFEQSLSTVGLWMALAFGVQLLCASYYVRRWPAIPRSEFSYARYVIETHERQSLVQLCLAVLVRVIACLGVVVGAIWFAVHYGDSWSDLTPLNKVVVASLPVMLALLLALLAPSTYRAWSVLRRRMFATS
jgi:hypothetical protein